MLCKEFFFASSFESYHIVRDESDHLTRRISKRSGNSMPSDDMSENCVRHFTSATCVFWGLIFVKRGIDLTLHQVSKWKSAATIGFDNTNRQAAKTSVLPFHETEFTTTLLPGACLVNFNETVQIPRNCTASLFPGSSL